MNPVIDSALALTLAPPQPHRPSTSCDLHPEEIFTGFCPSCLFERLSIIDVTCKNSVASSSKKPSSSSAALKGILKTSDLLFPELRRTKSFSARKNEAFSGGFEPQRRSCDVKVRNTLWSLFNEDLGHNSIDLEVKNSILKSPVFEAEIEIESEEDTKFGDFKESRSVIDEIVEEEEEKVETFEEEEEMKKVTEKMEFRFNRETTKKTNRDFKEIAGSFLSAASVFSKKLQKWRQNQKLKKHRNGGIGTRSAALPVERSIKRQLRDTQSEIAEYGYGRRSCDTDPRFSIDAGRFSLDAGRISVDAARVSIDDPRYSFDELRASWDGYLIGRTVAPPRIPSMLSVVEDSPISNHILRSIEKPPPPPSPPPQLDEIVPGGSTQTREYYNDSSSRRRRSFDRSSSTKKLSSTSIIPKIEEQNPKITPSQNAKVSISHSNSLRNANSIEFTKKSRRWNWNIFKLLHRKNGNKFEEEGQNGADRKLSRFDPKMMSNSSVSWRSSGTGAGAGGGGFHRNSVDGYVNGKKKKFYNDSTREANQPVLAKPVGRNVMNFY